jgi:steroid delta-isomerase-like uncharacterized protein
MKLIIHTVAIKAPRERVYRALATRSGLAEWWTKDVTGDCVPGGTLAFRFGGAFKPDMQVMDLRPEKSVRWKCVAGEKDWIDNVFVFDLADEDGSTLLMFRQEYAQELDDRTYGRFNYNWGYYLTSLKTLCETGAGMPFGRAGSQGLAAGKIVARRLAEEVFSDGNMRTFDEIFAANYVNHTMPVPGIPGTKEGFKLVVAATRQAFPDVHVNIRDMVAEGDFVVFRDTVQATSRAAFFGVPANGERLEWTEIHFLRIVNGQIVEHWANFDQLGILRQLGAIPSQAT